MNTTQTPKGEHLVSIQINVAKEDYEPQVKKELNKLQKKANIPGFRAGMVPFGMIKKMYGPQATIEVLNTMVSETLNNYIFDNKLDLIGYPLSDLDHQQPVDFDSQDSLDFFFEAALRPEIHVDFSKSAIDFTHVIADDKSVDKTIEELVERNPIVSHPETVEENDTLELKVREAQNGEEVDGGFQKDYVMFPVNDIRTKTLKKKVIGKEVGSEFIVNFAELLGSEEKVTKLLGENAPAASDFNIIIDDIRREEVPVLDEEFFKKIYPNKDITDLETFRAYVKADMERQYGLRGELARRRENQRTRMARFCGGAGLHQPVEDRQHERGGLARAGLGTSDQVASLQQRWNRLLLYRRGHGIAGVRDRVLQAHVELPEHVRLVCGGRRRGRQLRNLRLHVLLGQTEMRLRPAALAAAAFEEPWLAALEIASGRFLELFLHLLWILCCFEARIVYQIMRGRGGAKTKGKCRLERATRPARGTPKTPARRPERSCA